MNTSVRTLLIVFIGILAFGTIAAQNDSPYDCIYNHLNYLQASSYQPNQSAKSFEGQDSIANSEYAIKLKQVLDGLGLFVHIDEIPSSPTYYDSTRQNNRYYLFPADLPNIYVNKLNDKWVYPDAIKSRIDKAHAALYPFGTQFLMNLLPTKSNTKWLGLFLWQWLGIVLLVVAFVLIFYTLSFVINRIIRLVNKSRLSLLQNQAKLLSRISSLVSLLVSVYLLKTFLPLLQLNPQLSWLTILIIKMVSAFLILLIILRVVDVLAGYFHELTKKTSSKMDEQLLPVLKRGVQLILISFWLIYLLTLFNIDVTALLAGISIGGVAIALAAQDTLKNLFGSFTIFADKPFQIGDWIQFGTVEGTVEEVGFRSTRVRSFENSLMSVPNAKLLDTSVNNYGLRQYRRFKTNISITYDTAPDKIELFVQGLRSIVALHPDTRKDGAEIHLNNMGASSLDILFYMFFDVSNWTDELRARQEVILGILRLAKELGVEFAFPSMSLYQGSGVESQTKTATDLSQALEDFKQRIDRT